MGKKGRRPRTLTAAEQISLIAKGLPDETKKAADVIDRQQARIERQQAAIERMMRLLHHMVEACTCGGVGETLLVGLHDEGDDDDAEAGSPVAEGD